MDRGQVSTILSRKLQEECAFPVCLDHTHPVSSPHLAFWAPEKGF